MVAGLIAQGLNSAEGRRDIRQGKPKSRDSQILYKIEEKASPRILLLQTSHPGPGLMSFRMKVQAWRCTSNTRTLFCLIQHSGGILDSHSESPEQF